MNKIGFCTGFATIPLWGINDLLIKRVVQANFDYIVFPLMSIMELNEDKYGKLLALIENLDINTPVMCNLFPSFINFLQGPSGYSFI
ncbi:MAG: hypothetical protein JJE21_08930 [Spirochaetaceae bacterium]|nr:hypothetical protein [Spirochaetaceae bacterium]